MRNGVVVAVDMEGEGNVTTYPGGEETVGLVWLFEGTGA